MSSYRRQWQPLINISRNDSHERTNELISKILALVDKLIFTWSETTMETPEQYMKPFQSYR